MTSTFRIRGMGLFLLALGLAVPARAQEMARNDEGVIPPAPASDEGERAIAKMRPAKGLKIELFAAEPLLASPVALNFDEQGRCYVVETYRMGTAVIDVRGHMDWLDDDLMAKSVEDRVAWIRRKLGPNARTYTYSDDIVRLIEDSNGDGRADKSTVFASGFNKIEDGIAAGIVIRKGNVYLTDIPHLWLLKDTTGAGKADVRKSLSYGYGVHYEFIGHDLHGPRFGPDGKLYFSIGDRAANVTQSVDGSKVQNLDSGSVFRCNPDGSGLEIFATGLRNPQSLAFDDYGNLFTGDNNPDYGDPARWVYVVEGGDSGWRVGYQTDHNPIGGGPWMWEHLWQTQENSNAAYLLPPIAHLGAGPSGVAYYPGTGLSDRYQNHFFECDFRGGFTGSGVHAFAMKPKGAGFEMTDLHDFVWNVLATDIAFGPRGGAYITDWVQGWGSHNKGRIYRLFDPDAIKAPIVEQTRKLIAEGMEKRSEDDLINFLGFQDQRIRQEAQFELAVRGHESVAALTNVATKGEQRLPRIHAMWALGQIGEKSREALEPLVGLLSDTDDEVRAQAAKLLGTAREAKAYEGFVRLLSDASPRVRFFAALGVGKLGRNEAIPAVMAMIRENDDKDVYLRHAGVMALTWIKDAAALESAAKDESAAVRMASLLAMRRHADPQVAQFLHDKDPRLVLEAARAINDLPIESALPQLAELVKQPELPDYVMIRAVNANYRLGTPEAASALAQFAGNPKAGERWRVAALEDLRDWATPGHRDRITNLARPLPDRDAKPAQAAVAPALSELLTSAPTRVRVAALSLIQKLGVRDTTVLLDLVKNRQAPPEVRQSAVRALAAQDANRLPEAVSVALADPDERVRAEAIRASAKLPNAVDRIEPFLGKGSLREQQAALDALGDVPGNRADAMLDQWMDRLLAHQVRGELQLDVLDAAAKRQGSAQVRTKLQQYVDSKSKSDKLAEYRECLTGGDAAAGEHIFRERADVSCIRCHTIHHQGGIVGPVLDGIGGKQPREYLLESIVDPNAKIAPGFESVIVKLKDGRTLTGVVKREDDRSMLLIDADNARNRVNKSDIVTRERGASAMPQDIARPLSKRDLRDLVEFLAELK